MSQDIGMPGASGSAGVESAPVDHCGGVEGRSQSEVAREYGVSQGWISRLVARYRDEGQAAFEPRSRRPNTSPGALDASVVEVIVRLRKELSEQGLDAGPATIAWHLQHHHQLRFSPATISRYLSRRGLVVPEPAKRPSSSYIRFQAELPNECWQADFTHYWLTTGDGGQGAEVEILTWLDDHSRFALSVTARARVAGDIGRDRFRETVAVYGVPASTLTDIQAGCAALSLSRRPAGKDRCRPAPARQRCFTEWSAARLLAC